MLTAGTKIIKKGFHVLKVGVTGFQVSKVGGHGISSLKGRGARDFKSQR